MYLMLFCLYAHQILLKLLASQKRLSRPALSDQFKKKEIGWACGMDMKQERGV